MRDTPQEPHRADEARPCVVALHASAASGRQWSALAERMPDVELIAPDLAGHGAPAGPSDRPVEADTAHVARVLATRPLGVHLVGHSYGGAIALRAAALHPERVRSLIVFEPVLFDLLFAEAPDEPDAAAVRTVGESIGVLVRTGHDFSAAERFVQFWGGDRAWAALDGARRAGVAARMTAVAAHFTGLAADRVPLARLRAAGTPVVHLRGERTRPAMRRLEALLRSALPGAGFRILPAMDHLGPLSHPGTVAQCIERTLRARFALSARGAAVRAA